MGATLPAGSRIAGFRIESLLGRGAMAEVYRARSEATGEVVALKLLDETLARDERFRQRFLRESQIASGLEHPNIVRTIGSGEDEGRLFLAMTLIEGADLRHVLREGGPLEPAQAVDIVAQVASALDTAHKAGLIHRDVKPGNILVAGDRAYVCDFGLARHVSSTSSLTGERGFVGTIDYVPPEQIEGAQLDGRADLYSLGCVLYESLAGQRPFERDSELSVVFAHLNEPPPLVTEARPGLPAAFDEVISTALAKNPADRYESCGELAAAARAALRGKRRRRRRPLKLAAAAIVVAALVAGAVVAGVLATRGGGHAAGSSAPPPIQLAPNALSLIDARSKRVVGNVRLGKPPTGVSAGYDVVATGRAAWVLLAASQTLTRVDLPTRRVTRAVRLPWVPAGRIAAGGGFVWATRDGGPGVIGVAQSTGHIDRRFPIDTRGGTGVAYGAGSLWLSEGEKIVRVDPRTGRVLKSIPLVPGQGGHPGWLVFAGGWLWAAAEDLVRKIDPVSNRIVAKGAVPGRISDIAVHEEVWVTITPDDLVARLNLDDLALQQTLQAGRDPERLSIGGGRVWIANAAGAELTSVSEATGARSQRRVTARPQSAVLAGRLVLVTAKPLLTPLPPIKGDEIRVSTPEQVLYVDPASPRTPQDKEVAYATCANLLGFGGRGGLLRPDVAAAMPAVSADGRSYTFRIRPGFRFSPPSNQPVTAQVFRYSIERAFAPSLRGWAGSDVHEVVGLDAFLSGRAKHISGIVAHGDTLRITLTEPDGAFPQLISQPEFCPVPLGTPVVPNSVARPIPRDGPYYVTSVSTERTVLLRNPNYRGTRPRKPARIVYSTGTPTIKAVSLADQGELDYLPDNGNAGPLVSGGGPLDQRYGPASTAARRGDERYLHGPTPAWDAVVLNASRPLFRPLRMRLAVEHALDRVALAHSFGDVPGESLVPPAVAGFGHAGVYPLHGDLVRARRLAGRGRHTATLYYCTNGVFGGTGQLHAAVLIRRQLARIGIAVSITSPSCGNDDRDDANARRADLILGSTYSSVLDPEAFLAGVVDGDFHRSALGAGLWTQPGFRARLRHAHALSGAARVGAFRRIESDLLRAAPIAVYGYWDGTIGYFSPRVGCRIVRPGVGVIDLGALCKKA
jgi:ABC-type transport system substrate-binding protein/predicted Ser/Thr protein kinase